MPVSTNDFANKLWKAANFYDEFGLSPKTATLLYAASNIARSVSGLVDKNDELKAENKKLRELVRDYHRFADAMCAERDCDGCSQCDEGACERGVLTSRECVLGVEVAE